MAIVTMEIWSDSRGKGRCRSCDATITWVESVKSGKKMPINGDPVALQTRHDPATHRLIETIDLADSHFATCPQADSHRKTR